MSDTSAARCIAIADADLKVDIAKSLQGDEVAFLDSWEGADVASIVLRRRPKLVIIAGRWNEPNQGLAIARSIRTREPALPIILLMRQSSESLAVAALRARIDDYFTPPWAWDDIRASVRRHLGGASSDGEGNGAAARLMVGDSKAIRTVRDYLDRVARTDTSVLMTGETGTGKEVAAQAIHMGSARDKQAFVCINCAAIPDTLFESELFGYEKGAFTGALTRREGQLKQADKGTVFFDEIGDMSSYTQAKLLRAIEGRTVYRVGGRDPVSLDIRIIAATNHNLERLVAEGTFRSDLYYRLNVARIQLPPLRDRREDVVPLADHFRKEMNARFRRDVAGFDSDLVPSLLRYDWPGNVRELRNVIEAAYVEPTLRRISLNDLPPHVRERLAALEQTPESERDRLLAALVATNWNMSKAAASLRWSRMTLYRKMAKHHISRGGARRAPAS
jgi:DNA-binding NtrC family response regulator